MWRCAERPGQRRKEHQKEESDGHHDAEDQQQLSISLQEAQKQENATEAKE